MGFLRATSWRYAQSINRALTGQAEYIDPPAEFIDALMYALTNHLPMPLSFAGSDTQAFIRDIHVEHIRQTVVSYEGVQHPAAQRIVRVEFLPTT